MAWCDRRRRVVRETCARVFGVSMACGARFGTRGAALLATALLASVAAADKLIEKYDSSLTTYQYAGSPAGKTAVQHMRPRFEQREVNIDGTPDVPPEDLGLASSAGIGRPFGYGRGLGGDWFPDGYLAAAGGVPGTRRGSIDLSLGNYSTFEIDLRLPAPGFSWTIGRAFNGLQKNSSDVSFDSDSYQGTNWSQLSQPEIVFHDDSDGPAEDMIYLVTSVGSYVEFVRLDESSSTFKGRNGAVGAFVFATGAEGQPDTWTYTGQHGYKMVFFGFDGDAGAANGQLWKLIDPAGNTAYVGSTSSGSAAISAGYDGDGRVTTAFDTANRRYTYSYSSATIPASGGVKRLEQVICERLTSGSWTSSPGTATVATVVYSYYDTGATTYGDAGNLKQVTVTVPLTDSGIDGIRKRYYRYWVGSFSDPSNPGHPNLLQFIVDSEGVRALDWNGTSFNDSHFTDSEGTLKPYAKQYFSYDANRAVASTWTSGSCGCSGAGNGVETITYSTNGSFSPVSGYDTEWKSRAIVKLPPETEAETTPYITQYFDEVGQSWARALTAGDPDSETPPPQWSTVALRNSSGFVEKVSPPDNISSYDHDTGGFSREALAGRYFTTTRVTSGDLTGFVLQTSHSITGYTDPSTTQLIDLTLTYPGTPPEMTVGAIEIPRALPGTMRTYTQPITTGTTGSFETSFAYTFHSGSGALMVKRYTQTNPAVSTGTNGSNSSTVSQTYFRADGTVAFQESPDTTFTYTQYSGGQLIKLIADTRTNASFPSGDDPSSNFGITETGDGTSEITTWSYDYQGRLDEQLLFSGTSSARYLKHYYSRLADQRQVHLSYADFTAATPKFYGPVGYTVSNLANLPVAQATVALASNESTTALTGHVDETSADPITAMTLGSVVRLGTTIFDESGTLAEESRVYFLIPGSGAGSAGTNFDATTFGYSDAGKRWRTQSADGTVSRTKYDLIGRPVSQWIGTHDDDDEVTFPGGDTSGINNMVMTTAVVYDSGNDAAPGWISSQTQRVQDSSTNERVTTFTRDGDGRPVLQTNPQAPHIVRKFDHSGRELASGFYSSASGLGAGSDPTSVATNRMALTKTSFDALGRVWKVARHKIDASDGSDDDSLETLTWFDSVGRIAKIDGEQLVKYAYDRLGRRTHEYVLAADDDTTYANTLIIDGDTVLEQRDTVLQPGTPFPWMTATISRHPDDYGGGATTGALDTNADADVAMYTATNLEGRIQISATWFDRFGRLTDVAHYGTYGGSDFDRAPSTPLTPSRSATELVTTTTYDIDGTVLETTDPRNLKTRFLYDQAGRTTATIGNYVNGTPSGVNGDEDVYTRYTYANGHQTTMWVDFNGDADVDSDDQVTTYTYGVAKGTSAGDSKIASGALLQKVTYPDSSGGSDVVTFAYNALGQQIWTKDQAGNIIEADFDTAGRETHRRVTSIDGAYDSSVLRISTTYDSLGRASLVTSWNHATAGSGTVVNEVGYTFDGWGNLTSYKQDGNSAIGGSGFYEVSYVYAKATSSGRNTLRRTTQTLCGETYYLDYLSTDGLLDDAASRVTKIYARSVDLARYWYLGEGDLVGREFPEPDVFWNQFTSGSPATYPDRDRFNRVTRSRWTKDLATDINFVDLTVSYDENSNVDSVDDAVLIGADVLYDNDNLNRLLDADEGTLSSGTIGSRKRRQSWLLSQTGNWPEMTLDLNGDNDYADTDELDETRTHSKANEIVDRDINSSSPVEYTLVHDAIGNLTDDDERWKYKYDAFGRLKELRNQSDALVAEYTYYGNNFRASEHYDANNADGVTGDDPVYYFAWDEGWRLAAVYRSSDTDPKERFLHDQAGASGYGGSSYIDDLVLRDRDANSAWTAASDTLEQRRYYCQSWRHDVVAMVTDDGKLAERARYSAYGIAFGIPLGDINNDGVCNSTDVAGYAFSPSGVRWDLNLDGSINSTDSGIASANTGVTLGRGKLSAIGNRFGYAGYESDLATDLLMHVRNRVYHADLGRWTRRDPIGYVDGGNLYFYCGGSPIVFSDPTGNQYCEVTTGVCGTGPTGEGIRIRNPCDADLVATLAGCAAGVTAFGTPAADWATYGAAVAAADSARQSCIFKAIGWYGVNKAICSGSLAACMGIAALGGPVSPFVAAGCLAVFTACEARALVVFHNDLMRCAAKYAADLAAARATLNASAKARLAYILACQRGALAKWRACMAQKGLDPVPAPIWVP